MTPSLPAVHHVIWCTTLVRGGCWWIAVDMRDVTSVCSVRTPAPSVSVSPVQPCLSDQQLAAQPGPCQCHPDPCQPQVCHPQYMVAQGHQVWPGDLGTDQVLDLEPGDITGSTVTTGDPPQSTLMTTPCQVGPSQYPILIIKSCNKSLLTISNND